VLAAALHGGLTQSVRSRVLDAFRDGRLPVLVATDVAARGIHVDDVSLVLQADPPGDHKDYLHRSGRTARAGEHGIVATLALPHQRRSVERMTRTVDVTPVRVRPGRGELLTVGGREPTGEGVSDAALRAVVDRPRRSRAGRPRRPRQSERGGRTSRAQ
jgi:superfamily II DNA/RNA helicase